MANVNDSGWIDQFLNADGKKGLTSTTVTLLTSTTRAMYLNTSSMAQAHRHHCFSPSMRRMRASASSSTPTSSSMSTPTLFPRRSETFSTTSSPSRTPLAPLEPVTMRSPGSSSSTTTVSRTSPHGAATMNNGKGDDDSDDEPMVIDSEYQVPIPHEEDRHLIDAAHEGEEALPLRISKSKWRKITTFADEDNHRQHHSNF
ncbi:hypothetical protein OROHE_015785 [Orobanche hederae]